VVLPLHCSLLEQLRAAPSTGAVDNCRLLLNLTVFNQQNDFLLKLAYCEIPTFFFQHHIGYLNAFLARKRKKNCASRFEGKKAAMGLSVARLVAPQLYRAEWAIVALYYSGLSVRTVYIETVSPLSTLNRYQVHLGSKLKISLIAENIAL
jgi:hypothetical protein